MEFFPFVATLSLSLFIQNVKIQFMYCLFYYFQYSKSVLLFPVYTLWYASCIKMWITVCTAHLHNRGGLGELCFSRIRLVEWLKKSFILLYLLTFFSFFSFLLLLLIYIYFYLMFSCLSIYFSLIWYLLINPIESSTIPAGASLCLVGLSC